MNTKQGRIKVGARRLVESEIACIEQRLGEIEPGWTNDSMRGRLSSQIDAETKIEVICLDGRQIGKFARLEGPVLEHGDRGHRLRFWRPWHALPLGAR